MPFVSRSWTTTAQVICEHLAELPSPFTNCFVCESDPTHSHQFFNVPVTQAEPEIEPNAMADDFRWKTMTIVQIRGGIHRDSMT